MGIACFIPIKTNSERISGKNFKELNGKKLYSYIIEHALEANVFDDIYVDTDSQELSEYCIEKGINVITRKPELSLNTANGNDLLSYHYSIYPNYDYYFQLFATSPYLQPKTIANCVNQLCLSGVHDSCFTAVKHNGFFWMRNNPINYRPCILPRSQDMDPVIEETTGLYGISNASLSKYRCRIGNNSIVYFVSKFEAIDINTEEDWKIAEFIGKIVYQY